MVDSSKLDGNLGYNFNLYQKFKAKSQSDSTKLFEYLAVSGKSIAKEIQKWENILEGENDGIAGNTLSLDRYFEKDGNYFFQTEEGDVIEISTKDGKVNLYDDKEEKQELILGLTNGAVENFDDFEFGRNKLNISEFSFAGTGNEITKNGKVTEENIDLTTASGRSRVQKILDSFIEKHHEIEDLRDVFGDEEGKAENIVYVDGGNTAIILQGDKVFQINDKGEITERPELNNSYIGDDGKLHLVDFSDSDNSDLIGSGIVIDNYSLDGMLAGSYNSPEINEDKLNVLEDVIELTGSKNLRELIGEQDNVIYSESGKYMFIAQDGQLLRIGVNDNGEVETKLFTAEDVAGQVDASVFAGFAISDEGTLQIETTDDGAAVDMNSAVSGSGDPHFYYGSFGHTFDFQGAGGHTNSWNKLIESDDF
ncbi:MAG: hypothetical protein PHV68_08720, partial [Candidatus Gastranaerophilales bacterium]|nr:hypothetical protein [Candidatus Gastranaerophilales bacterium]